MYTTTTFLKDFYFEIYFCNFGVCVRACAHAGALKGQKKEWDPLKLKL